MGVSESSEFQASKTPSFNLSPLAYSVISSHQLRAQLMTMELNTDFFSVLLKKQAKPIVKEAFGEFLAENGLALVQISACDSSKLLSTSEVAKLLGVDRHKVYDYIDDGLPAMQSKPYKFRLQDVNEYIAKNLRRK